MNYMVCWQEENGNYTWNIIYGEVAKDEFVNDIIENVCDERFVMVFNMRDELTRMG